MNAKLRERLATCARKEPFLSWTRASQVAIRMRRGDRCRQIGGFNRRHLRLNVYRCDCCGYWHIGNTAVGSEVA